MSISCLQALALGYTALGGANPQNLAATPEPSLQSPQWVQATVPSCDNTCSAAGLSAVISGYGGNGEAFFVCAADAHGGGRRGGYNFRPNWADKCYVGWGGAEEGITPYHCLCY